MLLMLTVDFALQSSKAQDYPLAPMSLVPVGEHSRMMLVCKVAAGRQKFTTENMPHLQGPPHGFDSVCGRPPENPTGSQLRYDELVVYKEEAVLPYAIVKYNYRKKCPTKEIGTGTPGPGGSTVDPQLLPKGTYHVPGKGQTLRGAAKTRTLSVGAARRHCLEHGGAGFSFHSPLANPPGAVCCQFFQIARTTAQQTAANYVSTEGMCHWLSCRCQWQSYVVVDVDAPDRQLRWEFICRDGAILRSAKTDFVENITLRDAMRRAQATQTLGFTFDRSKAVLGYVGGELSLDTQLPAVFFRPKGSAVTFSAEGDKVWENWCCYVKKSETEWRDDSRGGSRSVR